MQVMKDLTQGSIRGHILAMAAPVAVGMAVLTLYCPGDLQFVSRWGADALAGVGMGGNTAMLLMTLTQVLSAGPVVQMIGAFMNEPPVAEAGVAALTITSTHFVAAGFVFACSGLFQAIGYTWPSLVNSATRLVTFVVPAQWLTRQPGFELRQVRLLSVATVLLQAVASGLPVRSQLRQRWQGLAA